jgi:GAF domain-containing protein
VSLAATYAAGVVAAIPGEIAAIASCFRSLVQARKDILTGGASRADRVQSNLAKLRRIVGDLRSGLISTTISLSLMNIISESVERAVLFLVRREALTALGAFGNSPSGQPLAQLTRGLRLPLSGKNALTRALDDGAVRSLTFDETGLPDGFTRVVGKPRSGQCAVFPVMGGQRVIAVVYADNGPSNRAIEELDILELAAAQAGLALENELLRRQTTQH